MWLNEDTEELRPESREEFDLSIYIKEGTRYEDIAALKPGEDGSRYYTNPTIWISVLPGRVTGEVAHSCAEEILSILTSFDLSDIDVAFRESVVEDSADHGTALYKPPEDGDPLKEVIDNLSVALSLPIAGRDTKKQGTLGPYFALGPRLCAITARHTLFSPEDNTPYKHNSTFHLSF